MVIVYCMYVCVSINKQIQYKYFYCFLVKMKLQDMQEGAVKLIEQSAVKKTIP